MIFFAYLDDENYHSDERIHRDEQHIEKLTGAADFFFTQYMVPYLSGVVPTNSPAPAALADASVSPSISGETSCSNVDVPTASVSCPSATPLLRRRKTRKRRGVSMPMYLCGQCKEACLYSQDIEDDGDNSIQCDECLQWFDWHCADCEDDNDATEQWLCKDCTTL